ncbi:MAG: tRNA (N(6)-L-threonylcarbamoyladenosine(37)-C(2))-methylthiotransferase MtaB [Blautia sp.]|nr:tRNA (N(6)-L-threonylcarbamoyladenosine(37)-C(2))-methylthiotransferase MtaB [Blautia sp.]
MSERHLKACVHNLGCKVNSYESQAMVQLLQDAGYEIVPFEPGADIYIINTCTVTNIADRKSRQMLHRARKMNPGAVVAAAGCYAQTGTETLLEDGTVDLIIGNNRKQNIVEDLSRFLENRTASRDVIEIGKTKEYERLGINSASERVRAFVKVQDGCNQFCSYCIIPYARGRVRSRRTDDALDEIRSLASAGYQEIILTGIHLSSYGIDLGEDENLLNLIRSASAIPGIRRIRLGSLEPGIITDEFAEALSGIPEVCPHFHLSLQSGCDRTLARMNRRYTTAEFREKCEILRHWFDNPALTTDIITGFPGETEEDFKESFRFVEKIRFFETHVFPYSRREGTRADRMDGQLPERIKKERSARLLALNKIRQKEYAALFAGRTLEVLFEEKEMMGGKPYLKGHTREYLTVCAEETKEAAPGSMVLVKTELPSEDLHCNLNGIIIQ